MTNQEYIDRHYMTGGRVESQIDSEPEESLLTPGETVVMVLLGICIASLALVALVAQTGLLP